MDYFRRINYPEIKSRIAPIVNQTRADLRETTGYYRANAKQGWSIGRDIAKKQKLDPITSLAVKVYKTIAKTRIRGKDVTPLLSATVFSFTPILGTGLVGFALGKAAHPQIVKGLSFIGKMFSKLKLK